jgi:UDP-N-acetyl-D-glucosamine dehydrogenase
MQALESGKKVLNGSKVLVLGLSYKKDIDDTRESPSVELIKLLEDRGANVDYSDPFVVEFPKMRKYKFELSSVDINPTNLAKYDVCIISTDHSSFNYSMILKYANLIVDTRGVYKNNSNKKIISA